MSVLDRVLEELRSIDVYRESERALDLMQQAMDLIQVDWAELERAIDDAIAEYRDDPIALGVTLRPIRERLEAGERSRELVEDILRTGLVEG